MALQELSHDEPYSQNLLLIRVHTAVLNEYGAVPVLQEVASYFCFKLEGNLTKRDYCCSGIH